MALTLLPLAAAGGSIEGRLAYRKGNYVTALREFNSGDQGGPVGTYFLAPMFLHGDRVPKDEAQGLKLLRSSADDGYSAAQYYLGTFYYQGVGSRVDRPAAAAWFMKSAGAGYAEAQLAYGMVLLSLVMVSHRTRARR
jgi:TPR repeat protein